MPHYVMKLDDRKGDGKFAIYSTIIDGLLTPSMEAAEMRAYLQMNGYETWLRMYDPEAIVSEWYADDAGMADLIRSQARYYYFQQTGKRATTGFAFVSLRDHYFGLPRSYWRNGR